MSPLGPRHVRCVIRLNKLLTPRLVGRAIVQVQSSLKLELHWEPQPDMAVLRLREDDYVSGFQQALTSYYSSKSWTARGSTIGRNFPPSPGVAFRMYGSSTSKIRCCCHTASQWEASTGCRRRSGLGTLFHLRHCQSTHFRWTPCLGSNEFLPAPPTGASPHRTDILEITSHKVWQHV